MRLPCALLPGTVRTVLISPYPYPVDPVDPVQYSLSLSNSVFGHADAAPAAFFGYLVDELLDRIGVGQGG